MLQVDGGEGNWAPPTAAVRLLKIDVHTIGKELVAAAARGKVLEVVVAGTGADGTPACATVKPTRAWQAV